MIRGWTGATSVEGMKAPGSLLMTKAEQVAMKAGTRAAKKGQGRHEHGYGWPKQRHLCHYFERGWVEQQHERDIAGWPLQPYLWCNLCDQDHAEHHQCPQHPDYDPTP